MAYRGYSPTASLASHSQAVSARMGTETPYSPISMLEGCAATRSRLLRAAMTKLPPGGRVVLALDNDAGGDELSRCVTDLYAQTGRIDLSLVGDRPEQRGGRLERRA